MRRIGVSRSPDDRKSSLQYHLYAVPSPALAVLNCDVTIKIKNWRSLMRIDCMSVYESSNIN
jgi:hypothetical protein